MAKTAGTTQKQGFVLALLALQLVAAIYFLVDGVEDMLAENQDGFQPMMAMEILVAVALMAGVALSIRESRRIARQMRAQEDQLLVARGALADLFAAKFREWDLSGSESEVAIYALKGLTVGEIAALRDNAPGTIRAHLSRIYQKAGVASQSALVALFFDELLDPDLLKAAA